MTSALFETDAIRWVSVGCLTVVASAFVYVVLMWRAHVPPVVASVCLGVGTLLVGVATSLVVNMSAPIPHGRGMPPVMPGVSLPPTRGTQVFVFFALIGVAVVLWALAADWFARRKP